MSPVTYSWIPRDASTAAHARLEPDGIAIETSQGRRFDTYENILEVQLTPPVSEREPISYVTFKRKEFGFHALFTIWGPVASAPASQHESYNVWVRTLHQNLLDRGLSERITFKCGVAMNIVGWLIYGNPFIRGLALALAPVGIVGGIMMQSWGIVAACVGGGLVMFSMPKVPKPDVPKDLRRIRPYSPDALPNGCFARARAPEAAL